MISVVMPAYNAERFLPEAVESILRQSFRNFDFLIVDDGSTDSTPAILRRYAALDSRVRVIQNDHGGISSALNRGIAEADPRRPWVARMDADDVAMPDRFEKQLRAAAARPNVVVWGTYARHVNGDGKVLGLSPTGPTTEAEFYELRRTGGDVHVIHPTSMLRRDVLLAVGKYDGRFNDCEDFELFDRMAELGPVLALPEPLLLYRVHASSVSMKRFFNMRRFASYVRARHRARLEGMALGYEQFLADYNRRPPLSKLWRGMDLSSGFYYRKAGLAYGERRLVKAGACFALAAALNPVYALPRVWNQFLGGKARRLVAGAASAEPQAPTQAPAHG
jgi:glycosyltransferase involved in cell wall biosynthesis